VRAVSRRVPGGQRDQVIAAGLAAVIMLPGRPGKLPTGTGAPFERRQPGRSRGLSPHVIAVTCPPRIVAEAAQQARFIDMNAPVLADASHIVVEAHNGCAGVAYFYKSSLDKLARQGSQTPYSDIQRQLLEQGIERFASRVAALSRPNLVVEANYVDFDAGGSIVAVTGIRAVQIDGTRQTIDGTSQAGQSLWPRLTDFRAMSGYYGATIERR
jgi:hypothetical protein